MELFRQKGSSMASWSTFIFKSMLALMHRASLLWLNDIEWSWRENQLRLLCRITVFSCQGCVCFSSICEMNLEVELFTLQDSNSKLVAALHEANANVEQWKKQLAAYQEETDRLRDQVKIDKLYTMWKGCQSAGENKNKDGKKINSTTINREKILVDYLQHCIVVVIISEAVLYY